MAKGASWKPAGSVTPPGKSSSVKPPPSAGKSTGGPPQNKPKGR